MYLDFFGLDKYPFQLKPDPAFLYLSKAHARAKAYMEYTIWNRDGFLVITGEIGSGKTTLIKELVSGLDDNVVVATIHQTQLDDTEFLQAFLANFGIEAWQAKKPELLSLLRKFLEEQKELGHQVLLIVDEAQHLDKRALEEIRLLAAMEVDGEEVLSFILVGHPELMGTINAPDMEQLSQRVRLRYHIAELSADEIQEYISTRLSLAGNANADIIPARLLPVIYDYTGGIPRLINILCHAALMTACVEESHELSEDILRTAAKELEWTHYDERERQYQRKRATQATTGPVLICMESGVQTGEYVIDRNRVSIGRHEYNEIVVANEHVGRCHAEILFENGIALLKDLNSLNGTYLNGEKITEKMLKFGDTIRIKNHEFRYTAGTTDADGSSNDSANDEALAGSAGDETTAPTLNVVPRDPKMNSSS